MVSIELVGCLGADAVKKKIQEAVFYTFNICDNRKIDGKEVSMWYGCNLNRVSEKLLPLLKKGQHVFVRGVPKYRIFDSAKYHCKMVAVDVFVNEIYLVGAAPKVEASENQPKPESGDLQF